jgi:ABC-type nitrate/sulfonate/bicarbonate transport system permease component
MMGRETSNTDAVIAVMILIIGLGYIVDGVIFKSLERRLQHKWGLTPST